MSFVLVLVIGNRRVSGYDYDYEDEDEDELTRDTFWQTMRILDRYAVKELLTHLFFGVAMFSAILMGASVLPMIVKYFGGARAVQVLEMFILSVPAIVVVTFPMAMLLAALMGVGRLSSESELVAMLASGISLTRITIPMLVLAAVIGLVDYGFQETVVPACRERANRLVEVVQAEQGTVTQKVVCFEVPDAGQGAMVVRAQGYRVALSKGSKVTSGTLEGVIIVPIDKGGSRPTGVIYAKSAEYDKTNEKWRLTGIEAHAMPGAASTSAPLLSPLMADGVEVDFNKPPEDVTRPDTPPEEMKVGKLKQTIATLTGRGLPAGAYEIELQHRFSVPFAAIVFTMIGVPLGLRRQRTGSSLGMGLSVLIIFLYYIAWNYLRGMAKLDQVDAFMAAWMPNLVGLAIGAVLLQRAPK